MLKTASEQCRAEFRQLSGLRGSDSDAAGQLAGVGNSLLDLVEQTAGTEEGIPRRFL